MISYVGVDLGSTTTKAVVLGEDGRVLGRGITNSRSNYDLAARVATTEAFVAARFGLLREAVRQQAGEAALERLLRAFRLEQFLAQLLLLERGLHEEIELSVAPALRPGAHAAVEEIIALIRAEEEALFQAPAAPKRSDFFRDIAGAAWARRAEERSRQEGGGFDLLLGLFDKRIIQVENTPLELGFHEHIEAALRRAGEDPQARRGVQAAAEAELEARITCGTGYGRARLPFPKEWIRSEILCHGLGAHAMFPGTRTVLDIGGQDTKAIQVDGEGIFTGFQMNDRCAAGCGRYLGYIADEMNIGLHELGPIAQQSQRRVRINSTCTVFAGAELRERLGVGERREDILAGLHRAVILRAMSLLARSGGVRDEFTFTGGVANNPAAVAALRELVEENYGARALNISPDSIFTGALGAAIFALRVDRPGAELAPAGGQA